MDFVKKITNLLQECLVVKKHNEKTITEDSMFELNFFYTTQTMVD